MATAQKPKSARQLREGCQGIIGNLVLEMLVESGLPPATLDSFVTKKLGLPNSIAKQVRAAAYLRDQHPADWLEIRKISYDGHHPHPCFGRNKRASMVCSRFCSNYF